MTPLILHANALNIPLADGSIQCAVTSPPYWGLRDYGHPDQIGQEPVHDCLGWATGHPCNACYVCHLVAVFREVHRVLRSDGTLWLNLGDSYAGSGGAGGDYNPGGLRDGQPRFNGTAAIVRGKRNAPRWGGGNNPASNGLKPKDLAGVPWRVALALQADGWYLRSEIIWHKPNPMPESVKDRPTKSHETIFLLTKSPVYYYDAEGIKEVGTSFDVSSPRGSKGNEKPNSGIRQRIPAGWKTGPGSHGSYHPDGRSQKVEYTDVQTCYRNARTVWTIPTHPYAGAHFATFPPKLIEPCILAGTSAVGCCSNCGAPWQRLTETPKAPDEVYTSTTKPQDGYVSVSVTGKGQGQKYQDWRNENPTRTIGWAPTCQCNAEIIPCTVLDPFSGAGTTALVAARFNRHAVGIELNPTYIHLSQQRLAEIQPTLLPV